MAALRNADAVVCVMPCGRSAHLELGYAIGTGKLTYLVWDLQDEPDVMHRAVDAIIPASEMKQALPQLLANPSQTPATERLYHSPQLAPPTA